MFIVITTFSDYTHKEVVKKEEIKLNKEQESLLKRIGFTDAFILSAFKAKIDPWNPLMEFKAISK